MIKFSAIKRARIGAWPRRPQAVYGTIFSTGLVIIACLSWSSDVSAAQEVRVGIYDDPPKLFINGEQDAVGMIPEVIREMAPRLGWEVTFVPCE